MDKIFTTYELNKILNDIKVDNYNINTVSNRFSELYKFLSNKKLTDNEIKICMLTYPRILTYPVNVLKTNYDNLRKLFKSNTKKMIIDNIRLLTKDELYIKDKIKYLTTFNIDNIKVKKMCVDYPNLLLLSKNNIEDSLRYLNSYFKDTELKENKDLIELFVKNPRIVSYDNNTINDKIKWFSEKGYSLTDSLKVLTGAKSVISLDYNLDGNMDNKYNFLLNTLGYKPEQIIYITTIYPEYYTLSNELIINRLNNLCNLGLDKNIVKIVFYKFSQIVSLKEDNINNKYELLSKLNMLNIFIEKPKYLMQSLNLTSIRYDYLINKGIKVDNTCYKKLFLSSKKFKKSYGVTNEELLNLYKKEGNYNEQRRNKKSIR